MTSPLEKKQRIKYPFRILPGIFISNWDISENEQSLHGCDIQFLINLTNQKHLERTHGIYEVLKKKDIPYDEGTKIPTTLFSDILEQIPTNAHILGL